MNAIAVLGIAAAVAMVAGSLMEWFSLGGVLSVEGTQRNGDVTLVLGVAAAFALGLWSAKPAVGVLPVAAGLAFASGVYIVVADGRDMLAIGRSIEPFAQQLNPAATGVDVVTLSVGIYVTGAAALVGLLASFAAALYSDNAEEPSDHNSHAGRIYARRKTPPP